MPRTYLDHAATTPMVPEAVEAMTRELTGSGNASSLHSSGRAARRVVEESRELIADRLGARPADVIFTAGATEADNLAVKGAWWSGAAAGRTAIVLSAIEHHAVADSAHWLAKAERADVREVPVDPYGRVRLDRLAEAVDRRTAVVSVIWASNEVGTVQPISSVVEVAHRHGALAHSDAVQAVAHLPVEFAASGLDLLSLTAHKLGGPYGVGALLARREAELTPVLHGGGQERDLRSGTLDVPAIAGFAAAVDMAVRRRRTEAVRLAALREQLVASVRAAVPDAEVYGSREPAQRLPGLATIGFPGCSGEVLLMLLDAAGIDVSTGSACSAGVSQPNHTVHAMGATEAASRSVLRFSLGHTSTAADVAALADALPAVVDRARAAGVLVG